VAGEHVPDGLGEGAGHLDAGDPGTALLAKTLAGPFVALPVAGVPSGVGGGLDQCPAQVRWAVLGERSSTVALAGLVHTRTQARVADELPCRGEPGDVADLRGDRVAEHPGEPWCRLK